MATDPLTKKFQMLIIPSLAVVYFFAQLTVLAVPVPFYHGVSFQPPEPTPVLDTRGWVSHITKVAGALAGYSPSHPSASGPMSSPVPARPKPLLALIPQGMVPVFPDHGT
ncbi:hypothetical protein BYT27DRAFT_7216163 [Phlegmacium glaucopus]|nr:hypothetical protein BYT27DRAFT_7216163 [Phlegmacium glaucopus]